MVNKTLLIRSNFRNRYRQRGGGRSSRVWETSRRHGRSIEEWPPHEEANDDDEGNDDEDKNDKDDNDESVPEEASDGSTGSRVKGDECNCSLDVTISMLTLDTSIHGYKVCALVRYIGIE